MWFKNLIFYRIDSDFTETAESLEEKLAGQAFEPCASQQLSSMGWSAPLGKIGSDMLVHAGNGAFMLCARKEDRILPASVIKDFVNEKVATIEEAEMRKLRRQEKEAIRDEVVMDLTPRAFTRSSFTWGLIMPEAGFLVLNCSSAKKADEFTSLLHESVAGVELHLPMMQHSPADFLTAWVTDPANAPDDIEVGDECELLEPGEEGSLVRCRRQDLAADEIKPHLEAGKRAVKLGMTWDEKLSFVLADDVTVKRLRYSDELLEEASLDGDADAAAQFDADFALMVGEFTRFLPRVLEILGGEVE